MPSELSDEQRQTVEKCTDIVQEFRAGSITKSKASWLLQRAIPHDDISEDQFLSTYEPYFDMLDNFDRYQHSNAGRIENVHQQLTESHINEPENTSDRSDQAGVTRPTKRPSSPQSEERDDEYTKRTRLDYDALPWNDTEDPEYGPPSLSQAVQETR